MNWVELQQFRADTGLSATAIVGLLESNQIPCKYEPNVGLLLDVDAMSTRRAIQAILSGKSEKPDTVLVEEVARIIRDNLDSILDQA